MQRQPESVLLVDGHSLIHRAFHALPPLSVGGVYTNAVQGFFSMLFKAIADYRPEALCVMLDMHAPTFRHTMFDEVILLDKKVNMNKNLLNCQK